MFAGAGREPPPGAASVQGRSHGGGCPGARTPVPCAASRETVRRSELAGSPVESFRVVSREGEMLVLDGNHPLAGRFTRNPDADPPGGAPPPR